MFFQLEFTLLLVNGNYQGLCACTGFRVPTLGRSTSALQDTLLGFFAICVVSPIFFSGALVQFRF